MEVERDCSALRESGREREGSHRLLKSLKVYAFQGETSGTLKLLKITPHIV